MTASTTYRYQARTSDAAGNLSTASNTVTVTTGGGGGGCSAGYRIVNAWDSGFQAEVGVTNTSTGSINGWRVTLTLAGGASITQIWGGLTTQTASPYTVANETYNGALGANTSTTLGFIASANGTTCANGRSPARSPDLCN